MMEFKKAKWIWLVALAGIVVICDQVTKTSVKKNLAEPRTGLYPPPCNPEGKLEERTRYRSNPAITVVDGYFHLRYVENCGGAFGFLSTQNEKYRRPFFYATSLLATIFLLYLFVRIGPREKVLMVAFSLILGGAIGNVIDRVSMGYVVDFIEWHLRDRYRWPTFNIADVGITVGLVLILIDSFFLAKKREPPEGEDGKKKKKS
jgi:signal peptidase II